MKNISYKQHLGHESMAQVIKIIKLKPKSKKPAPIIGATSQGVFSVSPTHDKTPPNTEHDIRKSMTAKIIFRIFSFFMLFFC